MRLMRLSKISLLLLIFFTVSLGRSTPGLITFHSIDIDPQTKEITIDFTIPKKDFIYKDFITCSIDTPDISLSPWKANKPTVARYDSSFKEAKQVFNEDFSITFVAAREYCKTSHHISYLYCSYYRHSDKKINHIEFPLSFPTITPQSNEIIDTTFTMAEDFEPIKRYQKNKLIERYALIIVQITSMMVTSIRTDHAKYFALLLFLLSIFIAFFYFFKKELKKQIRIKELLEIIISLFIMAIILYLLIYIYIISTPLITMILAGISTVSAGLFYIKKSTKVRSKNLRTFCTFLGMFCIFGTLLLSFKALQYADQQFNLL